MGQEDPGSIPFLYDWQPVCLSSSLSRWPMDATYNNRVHKYSRLLTFWSLRFVRTVNEWKMIRDTNTILITRSLHSYIHHLAISIVMISYTDDPLRKPPSRKNFRLWILTSVIIVQLNSTQRILLLKSYWMYLFYIAVQFSSQKNFLFEKPEIWSKSAEYQKF